MGRLGSLGVVVALLTVAGCGGGDDGQKSDRQDPPARSALFVTAGGGVAVTCRVPAGRASALDRDLAPLFSSLRLRREPSLERAQPAPPPSTGCRA